VSKKPLPDDENNVIVGDKTETPLLAQAENILDLFASHLADTGLAGEERLTKVTYLTMTSRLLPKLVSLAVKGTSASGKSYIIKAVTNYFPPSAYFAMTSMSEKALIYTKEDFRQRFLIVYEASGMASDFSTYLIRTLLSEGSRLASTGTWACQWRAHVPFVCRPTTPSATAVHHQRQHLRPGHDAGREGRGPDPRQLAVAGGAHAVLPA